MIHLIEARIDIALRAGQLPDSDWVARPMGRFEIILCAAPAYIERHGMPANREELNKHHWLASPRDPHAGARIVSNNQLTLQQMCEQGMGLARLAHADAAPALARGLLVRVLPALPLPALPVTALTPGRSGDPAKTRVALDALRRHFAALPGCLSG